MTRLLPKIKGVRECLRQQNADYCYTVSLAPGLALEAFDELLPADQRAALGQQLLDQGIARLGDTTFVRGRSLELMQVVDVALVTSGTATLECALSKTPMAVAYVMNPMSYRIAKSLVKLSYISLVNLVADEALIREFIQDFSVEELAQELARLATDNAARQSMQEAFIGLFERLKGDLAARAAQTIRVYIASQIQGEVSPAASGGR